jgi:hypothetical protein
LSTLPVQGYFMRFYRYILIFCTLLVAVLVTACGVLNEQPTTTSSPTQEVDLTMLPPPAETVVPQNTIPASPQVSPLPASARAVLISSDPPEDPYLFESISLTLEQLSSMDGLSFEVRSSMPPEEVDESMRLVVVIPPDPGLTSLVNAAPDVHFLAIAIPGLQPASNLSLIPALEESVDQVAFLAGYMAAVVTPDWRVGVISGGETTSEIVARSSFQNGAIFFCGLCQLSHPPYHPYPLYATVDSGSGEAAWRPAADDLISRAVRTVYVTPGVEDETLLSYLADVGIRLIGSGPPPDAIRDHWIASVRVDYQQALLESWSRILSADSGLRVPLSILIEDVNQELFTPGRQLLVETLLPDLEGGFIDTGANPHNGQDN